jgi:phytol kinase
MTTTPPVVNSWIAQNPWIACASAFGAFVLLFAGLQTYARSGRASAEMTRKLLHAGSGAMTLTFPFLFRDLWPVLLLTGASGALVAAARFVPSLRSRLGCVASGVDRPTLGELYFPMSIALLFWLTHDQHPLLFVIPVLILTLADAVCALVGRRYGSTRYIGSDKSLEGSLAFLVIAFFCVHVPLLLWSEVGGAQSLLIAATLAPPVMLLEAVGRRGLDNLLIPIGSYVLLNAYLS